MQLQDELLPGKIKLKDYLCDDINQERSGIGIQRISIKRAIYTRQAGIVDIGADGISSGKV
jgi:hypothetical protein